MAASFIEEALVAKLRELSAEKQQEVLDFANFLATNPPVRRKVKSLRGLWKGMGIEISEEDIAEARKEMWSNFPREEFFK
jgi:Protein of unknown function (DUF2281)